MRGTTVQYTTGCDMLHISLKIERNVYLLNTVLLHYCPDLQPSLADLCFIYNANLNSCLMRSEDTSSRCGLAALPPLVKSSRAASQSLYDNSFAVVGPKLWNILPALIKNEDTITSLKATVHSLCSRYPDTYDYVASLLLKTATPC